MTLTQPQRAAVLRAARARRTLAEAASYAGVQPHQLRADLAADLRFNHEWQTARDAAAQMVATMLESLGNPARKSWY